MTRPNAQAPDSARAAAQGESSTLASEYDRIRKSQMLAQGDEGWQAELRRYLKDFPADVSADTDLITWWQDNGHVYPTVRRVALDYLPCQASSVPCERLFSGGGEIATKRRSQLGAERFEELQVMKFAWRNNVDDWAAWNSADVEEVNETREYSDLVAADEEQWAWDHDGDEVVSLFA